jgi:hypothetical protein
MLIFWERKHKCWKQKKPSINKIKKSDKSPKEEKYQGLNTRSRKYYIKKTIKKKKRS